MRKTIFSKVAAIFLSFAIVVAYMPVTSNAYTTNSISKGDSFGTDGYYNVISSKSYDLVPGAATESEMVLNNSDGNRRQVIHVLEVDPSNPDVSIVPGYYNIDKIAEDPSDSSNWKAAGVTNVAEYYDTTLGYNVVGAMNTDLDYTDNAPRVLVYNGEILSGYAGASAPSSVLYVWDNDGVISCEVKAYKKSEMEEGVASGKLLHAISVSFSMVVNDGELVTKTVSRGSDDAARSMVGVKEDGTLVMCMNDGRGANNSKGFSTYEEGECMLELGCKWAANCDGGGSSSFVTRRAGEDDLVCRCVPCDGAERPTKSSVVVVSNVGETGELDKVNIKSDYNYFAPNTTYTFDTKAVDTHGYAMELPENASWALSDDSFGTIENGTFVSNGKLGEVEVRVMLNGEAIGTKTIHIANPETLGFTQTSTVLPYGKSTTLEFNSLIGEEEVYLDSSSFTFENSNPSAGTLDGLVYTAGNDESISGNVITATYVPTGKEYTFTIEFGKGSEIIWDFEDKELHGFMGMADAVEWQTEHGVEDPLGKDGDGKNTLISRGQISTDVASEAFIATEDNGGQVHNGDAALGFSFDMTQSAFNTWTYCVMFNVSNVDGDVVLRDVANDKKATAFGCWVYVPEGFYTAENSGALALQANLFGGSSKESAAQIGLNMQYNGKNLNSLTEADIPENRWVYVKADISGYNYVSLVDPLQNDYRSPSIMRMYVKPSVAQKLTYYFDDFTLDYSSAVDDRVPPTIEDPEYATSDTNISFSDGSTITAESAGFTAYVSDANSGLDTSTAAIYIDGNKVSTTKVSGNMMYCEAVALGVGKHKVKFEIADKLGNYTTLTRTIVSETEDRFMKYRTRIELDGHNDSGETPLPGSVYYIDVCNNYSEGLGESKITLNLNTANEWILDQLEIADGYKVKYEVNESNPNEVTFTFSSSKMNSSKKVMFTIPVRVYNPLITNGVSDGSSVTVSGRSFVAPLTVKMTSCSVDGSYGNYDEFSIADMESVRKIERHEHNAEALENKAATCTETGYTGRTYCDTCKSIVDFGEDVPAKGHSYELIDDLLKCKDCGCLFTGVFEGKEYTDGVMHPDGWDGDYYYIDGAKVTGITDVDGVYYEFDENGKSNGEYTGFVQSDDGQWMYTVDGKISTGWTGIVDDDNNIQWYYFKSDGYAATGTLKIDGLNYKFANEKGLCIGAWKTTDNGSRFYFCNKYYKLKWVEIEGNKYYFDNNGYRYEGTCAISHMGEYLGAWEFTEDGVLVDKIDGIFKDSRTGNYFYAIDGEVQLGLGLIKIEDDYYYVRGNGIVVSGTTWYVGSNNLGMKAGTYSFDNDGKMILVNGIVNDNGTLHYYINGEPQSGLGLIKIDDSYYYVRSNGALVTNASWYVGKDNSYGFKAGNYSFGEDGKMVMLNGIVDDNGTLRYYINGEPQSGLGLIKIDDSYYYVRSNGSLVVNASWYVSKDNGYGFKAGNYSFGEDGKMVMLNGIVDDNGTLRYYIDGEPQSGLGLIKIDDSYYYVRSNGSLVVNASWYVSKDNSYGFKAGNYSFGEDGKMVMLNGIVDDNGTLRYYIDGEPQAGLGLIKIDDSYYYVRSNGSLVTNATWYVGKDNKYEFKAGNYSFGDDGKLVL